MKDFKERLRDLREDHNYTQQEIATLIGVSDTTYQKYEYGQTEPTVSIIKKLVLIYKVSADYLLCIK